MRLSCAIWPASGAMPHVLERPSLEVKRISEKVTHTDITSDMAETLLDTFGTTSSDFVHAELSRLPGEQSEINAALAAIDGTRPENETAAMLASQMVVTHGLAMDMLGRVRRARPPRSSGGSRRSGDEVAADLHNANGSVGQAQARRRTDGAGRARACLSRRPSDRRGGFNPTGRGRGSR